MKDVTIQKLIKYYFSNNTLEWYSNEGRRISKKDFTFRVSNGDQCFTHYDSMRDQFYVEVGKAFYTLTRNKDLKDTIDPRKLKQTYKDMSATYRGVYYHEIAHVLYTDFNKFNSFMQLLSKKKQYTLLQLFKTVSNILEDVVIENELEFQFPSIKNYMRYLRLTTFPQEQIDKLQEEIKDDETINTFMNYFLYRYRIPSRVSFEHPVYTKHKKHLHSSAYIIMNTQDGGKRLERALALAYEISQYFQEEKDIDYKEVLKGKDEDWIKSLPESEEEESKAPEVSSGPTSIEDSSGVEDSSSKPSKTSSEETTSESEGSSESDDVDDEAKEAIEEEKDLGVQKNSGEADDVSSDPDSEENLKQTLRAAANDEPIVNKRHECYHLGDYYDFSVHKKHYDNIVNENEPTIASLVSVIKKIRAYNNSRFLNKQKRGKLDPRQAMKPNAGLKVFKKKLAPKREADLAVQLVVDNSGSMHGTKSTITGHATIALQESLYRLNIPFAIASFTEGHASITNDLIRFNDKYNTAKYNTTLLTKQKILGSPTYTFAGNVDEVNLDYIGTRFLKQRKEKDKIMIVLSDGATTGSASVLKTITEKYEQKGIQVLGIGIVDSNVKRAYNNYEIFDSLDDLKSLANVLQEYILNNIY